jgi:hypothetical protein
MGPDAIWSSGRCVSDGEGYGTVCRPLILGPERKRWVFFKEKAFVSVLIQIFRRNC